METINNIHQKQLTFFKENPLGIKERLKLLKSLRTNIKNHEKDIYEALATDLNKSTFESFISEISVINSELNHMIRKVKTYARPKVKITPYYNPLATTKIHAQPLGQVLIIAPWNYPFQLCLLPLIGAIAAGNVAMICPSLQASASYQVIKQIINETFTNHQVIVMENHYEYISQLKFDYIFFTGSTKVAKIIMNNAAKYLTPLTLELGGKNPSIITDTANLKEACNSIIWGKLLNSGQTCIASDYLIVDYKIKDQLKMTLIDTIKRMYTDDIFSNEEYPKIINKQHFTNLLMLIQDTKPFYGGLSDEIKLLIEPTLIDDISLDHPLMNEEIFGPILPIIYYHDFNEVAKIIEHNPTPLALYLFTKNKQEINDIINNVSYGGGCINDCIMQFASTFGGVGTSGMNQYHGHESFKIFTHYKSIIYKNPLFELKVRYAPFTKKTKLLNKIKR